MFLATYPSIGYPKKDVTYSAVSLLAFKMFGWLDFKIESILIVYVYIFMEL